MHASNICSTRGKNRNVCSLGWYPFVLWKWFEMVSLVDDLTAVEHSSKKCHPIMRCKWREIVESQTRRVGKWLKEIVAPAEGGREDSLLRLPFYGWYGLKKSHHGIIAFVGREIWIFGIVRASEKFSFCGFISEEKLLVVDSWPLITKQWQPICT